MTTTKQQWTPADRALLTKFLAAYSDISSAARALGIDRVTLWRWSTGRYCPTEMSLRGLRPQLTTLIRKQSAGSRKKIEK